MEFEIENEWHPSPPPFESWLRNRL